MPGRPVRPSVPSLSGAYARVRRARDHLRSLSRETNAFWKGFKLPSVYQDPETGGTINITISRHLLPPKISILVGEAVYNLRAALDYLVYEVATLDSGQRQTGTQFPIESALAGWNQHSNYLVGLSDAHKDAIRALQPFEGCGWTGTLRDVSNPDKHMELTIVQGESVFSREPTAKGPVIVNPEKEGRRILFAVNLRGSSPDANSDVSLHIAFTDGARVIETLRSLASSVGEVLDAFRPEFETPDADTQPQSRR